MHIYLGEHFYDYDSNDFAGMLGAVDRLAAALRANRMRFCKQCGVSMEATANLCTITGKSGSEMQIPLPAMIITGFVEAVSS